MKTLLIAASLLTLGVLGAPPAAAACNDPGAPGGGVLGLTQWYANANVGDACLAGEAAQATVVGEAGDAQAAANGVVVGALALVDAGGLPGAATHVTNTAQWALASEEFDACAGAFGAENCGTDVPLDQTQSCPSDLKVPKPNPPISGGIAGGTVDNANGVLQATCQAANAVGGAVPTQAEALAYAGGGVGAATALAASTPGDLSDGALDAAFGLAGAATENTCAWLTGSTVCLP